MSPSTVRPRIVAAIFRREVRDQVRDRRTLFMVFVIPLLLYPILGVTMLQLFAALDQKPRTVVLLGAEHLPDSPRLLNTRGDGFHPDYFSQPRNADLLRVVVATEGFDWHQPGGPLRGLRAKLADAVVEVPADLPARIARSESVDLPVRFDSTDEPSQLTSIRLNSVLENWRDAIVRDRLARDGKPADYLAPIKVDLDDVAPPAEVGGSIWGRIFPFLLMIMALTGAFYPAVDLCAGEKERGTMETLLLSPATRLEVVLGKFLTVMLASVMTAVFNLISMGITGVGMASRIGGMGTKASGKLGAAIQAPSLTAYFWMALLLIPISALFAATCVALATLARSMKEGQYYLTPLYVGSLPLILITLAPEIELDNFYSLVPITGASLLLKSLILGEYDLARRFFAPVIVTTLVCAALALRWAVELFRREDVIFREAEGFDLRLWLRSLVRDREATPGAGSALFCVAVMLAATLLGAIYLQGGEFTLGSMIFGHAAFILGVPVALGLVLASSPRQTFLLRWPKGVDVLLAAGLALALNPLVRELGQAVGRWFPATRAARSLMENVGQVMPNTLVAVLVLALMPAITEEVAFRGYILSGFRRSFRGSTAILFSAALFGIFHVLISLPQQLIPATLLGVALGWLAVRTDSLVPGVVFHFTNNALAVLTPALTRLAGIGPLFRDPAEGLYSAPVVAVGAIAAVAAVVLIRRSTAPAGSP